MGLEPASFGATIPPRVLQEVAQRSESAICKPISVLRFAAGCTVLRSRWCQSGANLARESTLD
jgi:hypothetical protein